MGLNMKPEQGRETNGSSEGKLEGNDYALLRRAVLSALAGAPVILTLSSSFANDISEPGGSMVKGYFCDPPRNEEDPGDQRDCTNPP